MESIANNDASPAVLYLYDRCAVFSVQTGQGRAGQGRAGQGRAAGICSEAHVTPFSSGTKFFVNRIGLPAALRYATAMTSKSPCSYLYDMAHWGVPSPPMGAGTCQLVSQSKVSR